MTFQPKIWRPIAIALSALNLVAVGFAAGDGEAWHAGIHAALALVFGLWAQRLRPAPAPGEIPERLKGVELELGRMRQELSEAQERLDFAERMLAQAEEARRLRPER